VGGHVDGPLPGWTSDSQQFSNTATGQVLTLGVGRGMPVALLLIPNQPFPYTRSSRLINGHVTYARTERPLGEREFTWIVGPNTTGFVGGYKTTDDELLRIADAMTIAP